MAEKIILKIKAKYQKRERRTRDWSIYLFISAR